MAYQLHKTEDTDVPLFILQKLEPLRGQYGDSLEVMLTYYTDLDLLTDQIAFMYGLARTPYEIILWRLTMTKNLVLGKMKSVALPSSEADERSPDELVEAAIHDHAWD